MTSHTARPRATDRPLADCEAPGLVGYARVSTGGQSVQRQVDELRKAGCAEILEETASGADRSRPVLAALLRRIRRGETLVCRREARSACPLPQAPAGCGPHPGGAGRGRLTPRRHAPY